jgi:hypothetical protein
MFANKTKVLLIVSQDILDQARVCAGKATTELKMPVSLQIVLRALIEEGLKRGNDRNLLANIQGQAHAVRHIRRVARRSASPDGASGNQRSAGRREPRRRK